MITPEKCPKCGAASFEKGATAHQFECHTLVLWEGTVFDGLICVKAQRDQLATKLTALESAYAECAEKLYRAEQREHDFKRRLADVTKQRDRLEQRVSELEPRAQGRDASRDIIMDGELASLRGFVERMENKP